MASQITGCHFFPLKPLSPPYESLHKMDRKQYRNLLRKMYMPFIRGPEDRHYFASFQDKTSDAFLKSNPFVPPEDENYPLAPHRDELPIINPCSGLLSPGAEAEAKQLAMHNRTIGGDTQPPQWPAAPQRKVQTSEGRHPLPLQKDQRWNSRAVPDISLRAKIGGWTSPVKVKPVPPKTKENFSPHTFVFDVDPETKAIDPSSEACRDEKARKYMYTSTIQSAYEEVPWDRIFPPKINPPERILSPIADCVAQTSTLKQYEPAAEISQVVGGLWDRFQRRPFTTPDKPINFVSPSSRTQHLPLYTGCVGAENFEELDNPYVDLITYGNVRITKPRYVKSSLTLTGIPAGEFWIEQLTSYFQPHKAGGYWQFTWPKQRSTFPDRFTTRIPRQMEL